VSIRSQIKSIFTGDGNRAELFEGASRSFFTKVTGLLFAYIFALVVTRSLGAEAWGEFALSLSIIVIGARIGTIGLDMGLLKLASGSGNYNYISPLYKRSLIITTISSFLISCTVYLTSEFIATAIFSKPQLYSYFSLSSLAIVPLSIINLNARTLQGIKKIQKYVFLRFVSRHIFSLAILLILLIFFSDSRVVMISFILSLVIIALLSTYWIQKQNINISTQTILNSNEYGKLYKLSSSLLITALLVMSMSWIDTIMVGIFLPEAEVGVFNISLKISTLLIIVLGAVSAVAAPKISESYSNKSKEDLQAIVNYSTSLIFYFTLPLFLILILFPEQILSVFGTEFKAGKWVLIILCIGHFINAISGTVSYFMQMTDSQNAFQIIMASAVLIAIGLNYYLIPLYGIEGAAAATAISLIFWNVTCVIFIKYQYNIRSYFNPFSKNI